MDPICMLEKHCQQCGGITIIQRKNNESLNHDVLMEMQMMERPETCLEIEFERTVIDWI